MWEWPRRFIRRSVRRTDRYSHALVSTPANHGRRSLRDPTNRSANRSAGPFPHAQVARARARASECMRKRRRYDDTLLPSNTSAASSVPGPPPDNGAHGPPATGTHTFPAASPDRAHALNWFAAGVLFPVFACIGVHSREPREAQSASHSYCAIVSLFLPRCIRMQPGRQGCQAGRGIIAPCCPPRSLLLFSPESGI